MHPITMPPSAGSLASIALAASSSAAGTVVAVAIALLFVGVVRLGHRSSAALPGGDDGEPGTGSGATGAVPAPPAKRGRRASP